MLSSLSRSLFKFAVSTGIVLFVSPLPSFQSFRSHFPYHCLSFFFSSQFFPLVLCPRLCLLIPFSYPCCPAACPLQGSEVVPFLIPAGLLVLFFIALALSSSSSEKRD
uniref:Uncharacterized protein n=1 Tax=Odontella aurita TaxID=265563 RepID=A0A7S4K622_9STRA